jgi:hypothetical protein
MEPKMEIDRKGNKFWRLHGRLHREDGPAAEWADGDKIWRLNGENHRTDGPAIECADGGRFWCQYGSTHRTDGPAVEFADGYVEFRLRGRYYTFEEWLEANTEISDEEKVMMKLQYG